ncbi:hypothetical protein, partial [uncultured Meiothermus sp.]|uniref:hypothetical protein n=1 Tax=uncultured Meiothermus sp. TaxID=157471 RepID=UPI00262F4878
QRGYWSQGRYAPRNAGTGVKGGTPPATRVLARSVLPHTAFFAVWGICAKHSDQALMIVW